MTATMSSRRHLHHSWALMLSVCHLMQASPVHRTAPWAPVSSAAVLTSPAESPPRSARCRCSSTEILAGAPRWRHSCVPRRPGIQQTSGVQPMRLQCITSAEGLTSGCSKTSNFLCTHAQAHRGVVGKKAVGFPLPFCWLLVPHLNGHPKVQVQRRQVKKLDVISTLHQICKACRS